MKQSLKNIVFLFLFLIPSFLQAASRTEFILDVSGSMNKMLGGETRIQAARKAIAAALTAIPEGSVVALRLYSDRIPQTDKAASCKDTHLAVPFGPVNKAQIQAIVDSATPLGQTPIAYSLEQAALDFGQGADEQPVIILVSDGEESCGGDPVAVAKSLIARGFKVKIHTIGIDVDPAARTQLEGISAVTGGQYKDARDASSLTSSLQQLTQDALLVKKEQAIYGDAIRGGDSYETAVSLPPGKLYRLDHHQRKDQFDYFVVDVKPGQKLVASVETGENGVDIRGGQAITTIGNPYAGLSVHSPQRQEIKHVEIIGGRNEKRSIEVPVGSGQDGKYYILIGSVYDNQNKDHRFRVDLTSQFDANTDRDAGDSDATAIEILQGTYDKNYLSANDSLDVFKINLPLGSYELKLRPENQNSILTAMLVDSDGVEIAAGRSPNPGAAAIVPFFTKKAGYVFIRVKEPWTSDKDVAYSLALGPASGTPPLGFNAVPPAITSNIPPAQTTVAPTASAGQAGKVASSDEVVALASKGFSNLGFLQKAKLAFIYMMGPAFGVFLIGLLWGYIWGRRSGKRKTLAKMGKAQGVPAAPPAKK